MEAAIGRATTRNDFKITEKDLIGCFVLTLLYPIDGGPRLLISGQFATSPDPYSISPVY